MEPSAKRQGLAWDRTACLFAADLVPRPHDEINEIVRGGNYGEPCPLRVEMMHIGDH